MKFGILLQQVGTTGTTISQPVILRLVHRLSTEASASDLAASELCGDLTALEDRAVDELVQLYWRVMTSVIGVNATEDAGDASPAIFGQPGTKCHLSPQSLSPIVKLRRLSFTELMLPRAAVDKAQAESE